MADDLMENGFATGNYGVEKSETRTFAELHSFSLVDPRFSTEGVRDVHETVDVLGQEE